MTYQVIIRTSECTQCLRAFTDMQLPHELITKANSHNAITDKLVKAVNYVRNNNLY